MIHVERKIPEPPYFSAYADRGIAEVTAVLTGNLGQDREAVLQVVQNSFVKISRKLKDDLEIIFAGKCAYCESRVGIVDSGTIDFFRPKGGVADADGGFQPTHYWRQAFEWTNFYLCCAHCNRNKQNHFPIVGRRAPADADVAMLRNERRLLLDPCSDYPEEHLVFSEDGRVSGASDEGRATIELLDLNRKALVNARMEQVVIFRMVSEAVRTEMLKEGQPYLALKRALVADSQRGASGTVSRPEREAIAREAQERFDQARDEVSVDTGEGLEHWRARTRYIESVSLESIGPIGRLQLDLIDLELSGIPNFAFLGVNGVGKSTVLRAIALALGGKSYARKMRLTSNKLLAANSRKGEIVVKVSGYQLPIVVTVKRGRPLEFNSEGARALVLAYGSSRLLATKKHKAKEGMRHAKIDNLFDPFLPVSDARNWLSNVNVSRRDDVISTLRALLPSDGIHAPEVAYAEDGVLNFKIGASEPLPIDSLSDGYKSLVGMAVDIMQVMYAARYSSMLSAQGVVIVDELGNHFHPSWKMRIVSSLREAFPKIQFIFSTHEPLCLRGMRDKEIAVLKRDQLGKVFALTNLPNIDSLRVDQILTSEHFGLGTTIDPGLEESIRQYESLALKLPRSEDEDAQFLALEKKLSEVKYLGNSRRERLLLKLIDAELDEQPDNETGTVNAADISEQAILRIQRVLDEFRR